MTRSIPQPHGRHSAAWTGAQRPIQDCTASTMVDTIDGGDDGRGEAGLRRDNG
eukprot:CAMPEP_0117670336 /NCGR_PEP_ID=MMETSP0804-20121206/12686_1 /TAXON_ID=1074897 /ORGANISM="Tetraselmis astigmatica, Strain CCMP880" /LENGTH=52 /DNA_ID=CAMNT_0005478603 /DNA_START=121 /DNA_END=277 /DNA_ORIENTATION=+